jgi:hypothetical protein
LAVAAPKPKTESEKFMDKLKSYVVTPSYSMTTVKIPDSSSEDDSSLLRAHSMIPSIAPFSPDSENGQLFDTHSQIVKMENQLIDKQFHKPHMVESSNSLLLKDLGVAPSRDLGFIHLSDDVPESPLEQEDVFLQISDDGIK